MMMLSFQHHVRDIYTGSLHVCCLLFDLIFEISSLALHNRREEGGLVPIAPQATACGIFFRGMGRHTIPQMYQSSIFVDYADGVSTYQGLDRYIPTYVRCGVQCATALLARLKLVSLPALIASHASCCWVCGRNPKMPAQPLLKHNCA